MAKFKAPDLEALQNEDGEINEEALDELIEKDKNYKKNNDGTHLNNIHIMRIVKFVDRELGDAENFIKTDVFAHMLAGYEQEQEFSEPDRKGRRKMLTGNSKEAVLEWLADEDKMLYYLKREYRHDMSVCDIARLIYQLQHTHMALVGHEVPLYKLLIWQNQKSSENGYVEADFLDWLAEHDEYDYIGRKLINMPDIDDRPEWYCQTVMHFGDDLFPELADQFTEREKFKFLAKWLQSCRYFMDKLYDLHQKIAPDPDFVAEDFKDFFGEDFEENKSPYCNPAISKIAVSMRMLETQAAKAADGEYDEYDESVDGISGIELPDDSNSESDEE